MELIRLNSPELLESMNASEVVVVGLITDVDEVDFKFHQLKRFRSLVDEDLDVDDEQQLPSMPATK